MRTYECTLHMQPSVRPVYPAPGRPRRGGGSTCSSRCDPAGHPHARPAAVSSPQRRPAGPALPTTPAVGPLYSRDNRDCADAAAVAGLPPACSDCACLPFVPDKPRPSLCSGHVVGPLIKAPIHCNDAAAPLYLFPIPATGGAAIVTFQISCQSHMISPVES